MKRIDVLICDDDKRMLTMSKEYLNRIDPSLNVTCVNTVDAAIEVVDSQHIDLIVSDYQMPDRDGLDLLRYLRIEKQNYIPFIIFTGQSREEVAIEALNLGASRFIQKGVDIKAQYNLLARIINQEYLNYQTQENLKISLKNYQKLFEQSMDAIFLIDLDSRSFIDVNQNAVKLLGYTKNELLKMTVNDINLPEFEEKYREANKKMLEEGSNKFENVHVHKDGTHIPVEISSNLIEFGNRRVTQANVRDLTASKKLEGQLQRTEESHRMLIQRITEGIVIDDADANFKFVNDSMCELIGYSREELLDKNVYDFLDEENKQILSYQHTRRKQGETDSYELAFTRKDGTTVPTIVSPKAIIEEGEYAGSFAAITNISKLKMTEELLRKEQQTAQKYLDIAGEIIVILDPQANVKLINKKGAEILGYTEDEIIGTNWIDNYIPESMRKEMTDVFHKFTANDVQLVEKYQNPVLTKDGSERIIMWHNEIIGDNHLDAASISSGIDLTDLILAQNERDKAFEETEFLHELLRHDVKNKTIIAEGYLSLIMETAQFTDDEKIKLEHAISSIQSSIDLISNIQYIRLINKEEERLDLHLSYVIEEVVQSLTHLAEKKQISFNCKPIPSEVVITAGSLINELFSNIIENAIVHSRGSLIQIVCDCEDEYVTVKIDDDGIGISERIEGKVFDKKVKGVNSDGSGLGLYLVRKIAENYSGEIKHGKSKLGGTCFEVKLLRKVKVHNLEDMKRRINQSENA
ncbi:MAG: PAS domain S-box protein [Candidatus Heimdallarchaeota archaeon]|nr:PAS domain S-box protein [Candidatus Heimdallarchaeota archaeon]MCK5048395.1 PAS domain S-box protein [Candidatus Heimdallarchaeota archaeon]